MLASRSAAPGAVARAAAAAAGRRGAAAAASSLVSSIRPSREEFLHRHVGIKSFETQEMVRTINPSYATLEDLVDNTVPITIRHQRDLELPEAATEAEALSEMREIAKRNIQGIKSCIGMGYYGTFTPSVALRNILENPAWYTSYTPYQAEIAQGRLEMLLNFQTMVSDLTGMDIANASLLDEATACAEAMALAASVQRKRDSFFVAADCHPHTISLMRTRGSAVGMSIKATFGISPAPTAPPHRDRVWTLTTVWRRLCAGGYKVARERFFDTIDVEAPRLSVAGTLVTTASLASTCGS
ncbi:hypothetical protein FNF28_02359 [Cafeteria roenbergensis]|uniref:Glycine cleavage system P-protein N-terminal domain-containing protein n=1 Tax=Cafeteria roenbergensis TaxID=33653 RepID=A0A5A8DTM9_CAFRO|nr:hypothetical protein FNF28_02359 [Cafeteria roenbergensis]